MEVPKNLRIENYEELRYLKWGICRTPVLVMRFNQKVVDLPS